MCLLNAVDWFTNEKSLAAATQTANSLIFDLAQRFYDTSGVPVALIEEILGRAQALQEQLIHSAPASPALRESQAIGLIEIARVLLGSGDATGYPSGEDRGLTRGAGREAAGQAASVARSFFQFHGKSWSSLWIL